MYLDYWQLEAKPFEPVSAPQFVFASQGWQTSLHKLRYAVENRRSAALLAGCSGVGKTLLVENLAAHLGPHCAPWVRIVFPQMSDRDLLVYVAEELGAPPADPPRHTIEESLRRLEFALRENAQRGRHALIIVDESHLLEDAGLFEPLRLLLNLTGPGGQPLFTLLFVGQPTLVPMVQRHAPLDERIDVKAMLPHLTPAETAGYLDARLAAAGASRPIFSQPAKTEVHRLTGGVPRRINRLCDLALLVAYAEGLPNVEPAQLRAVSDELVTLARAA